MLIFHCTFSLFQGGLGNQNSKCSSEGKGWKYFIWKIFMGKKNENSTSPQHSEMEEGRGRWISLRKKSMLTFVAEDLFWTQHFLKLLAQSQGCLAASVPRGGADLNSTLMWWIIYSKFHHFKVMTIPHGVSPLMSTSFCSSSLLAEHPTLPPQPKHHLHVLTAAPWLPLVAHCTCLSPSSGLDES